MSTLGLPYATASSELTSPVSTAVTPDQALASTVEATTDWRRGWQAVLDSKLIEWGRNPSLLEDEDLVPPSAEALGAAGRLALTLRDAGMLPPTRVVPVGDGGIAFELRRGAHCETLAIDTNGSIEYIVYKNDRLMSRERLL